MEHRDIRVKGQQDIRDRLSEGTRVAAALSLLIVWLGFKHGRSALYALLDASLDPELEKQATSIAERVPGVMRVEQLKLRRSGPFLFGIAHIHLRKSIDVGRAHVVAHEVARSVTEAVPPIETLNVRVAGRRSALSFEVEQFFRGLAPATRTRLSELHDAARSGERCS